MTSLLSLARSDSAFSAAVSLQARYGEAVDPDGVRFVSARALLGTLSLDAVPEARVTPFVFGTLESSLEKRIARRGSGGAGAKWVVVRTAHGEGSVSLAVLSEVTRASDASRTTSLTRWSWRLKLKRKAADRVTFSHTTFYQPVVQDYGRYTISSTSQLEYGLTGAVALTLSLVDTYDSEARARGARANNDGQLLAGLQASF